MRSQATWLKKGESKGIMYCGSCVTDCGKHETGWAVVFSLPRSQCVKSVLS